jgi:hypothetical protein
MSVEYRCDRCGDRYLTISEFQRHTGHVKNSKQEFIITIGEAVPVNETFGATGEHMCFKCRAWMTIKYLVKAAKLTDNEVKGAIYMEGE